MQDAGCGMQDAECRMQDADSCLCALISAKYLYFLERRTKMIKKFFDNFTAPEKGKVSDKTMTYNIIACVVGVLLCIASLTAVTWAWFADSISSPQNSLASGDYKLEVSIIQTDNSAVVDPDGENGYIFELDSDVQYTVTISASGSVSTGYCKVKLPGGAEAKDFYTTQIFTSAAGSNPSDVSLADAVDTTPESITFTITVVSTNPTEKVSFESWWGTLSTPDADRDFSNGGSYEYDVQTQELSGAQADPGASD